MRWGVVFLFAFCVPAAAQNPQLSPSEVAAFDKLLTEYSVCAAYLSIVEQCFPKDNAEQTERLAATIRAMTNMAVGAVGNNAGLPLEARRDRIRASYEAQSKSIGGSCSNITTLWEKHSARCNQLDEHPDQVFDEYMKK
jgi:hypothetical protein